MALLLSERVKSRLQGLVGGHAIAPLAACAAGSVTLEAVGIVGAGVAAGCPDNHEQWITLSLDQMRDLSVCHGDSVMVCQEAPTHGLRRCMVARAYCRERAFPTEVVVMEEGKPQAEASTVEPGQGRTPLVSVLLAFNLGLPFPLLPFLQPAGSTCERPGCMTMSHLRLKVQPLAPSRTAARQQQPPGPSSSGHDVGDQRAVATCVLLRKVCAPQTSSLDAGLHAAASMQPQEPHQAAAGNAAAGRSGGGEPASMAAAAAAADGAGGHALVDWPPASSGTPSGGGGGGGGAPDVLVTALQQHFLAAPRCVHLVRGADAAQWRRTRLSGQPGGGGQLRHAGQKACMHAHTPVVMKMHGDGRPPFRCSAALRSMEHGP